MVSSIEHFSVLNAARTMEKSGFEVTLVPVDQYGVVDLAALEQSVRPRHRAHLGDDRRRGDRHRRTGGRDRRFAREKGIAFHTDAVAGAAYVPIDVKEWGVTALSLASDLLYGPKGAGALYVRKGSRLLPMLEGGVQEGGRRSGTENMPAIVGMGVAAELALARREERAAHLSPMRDALIGGLLEAIPHVRLTGHPELRLPWNASFVVDFIEGGVHAALPGPRASLSPAARPAPRGP